MRIELHLTDEEAAQITANAVMVAANKAEQEARSAKLLGSKEVAKILGVCVRSIPGELASVQIRPGIRRWSLKDVLEFIESRKEKR